MPGVEGEIAPVTFKPIYNEEKRRINYPSSGHGKGYLGPRVWQWPIVVVTVVPVPTSIRLRQLPPQCPCQCGLLIIKGSGAGGWKRKKKPFFAGDFLVSDPVIVADRSRQVRVRPVPQRCVCRTYLAYYYPSCSAGERNNNNTARESIGRTAGSGRRVSAACSGVVVVVVVRVRYTRVGSRACVRACVSVVRVDAPLHRRRRETATGAGHHSGASPSRASRRAPISRGPGDTHALTRSNASDGARGRTVSHVSAYTTVDAAAAAAAGHSADDVSPPRDHGSSTHHNIIIITLLLSSHPQFGRARISHVIIL